MLGCLWHRNCDGDGNNSIWNYVVREGIQIFWRVAAFSCSSFLLLRGAISSRTEEIRRTRTEEGRRYTSCCAYTLVCHPLFLNHSRKHEEQLKLDLSRCFFFWNTLFWISRSRNEIVPWYLKWQLICQNGQCSNLAWAGWTWKRNRRFWFDVEISRKHFWHVLEKRAFWCLLSKDSL